MSQQPVYRRPRSHAYSCRCPRCVQSMPSMKNGDYGIIGPLALIGGIVALIGFWPAMVWHGYTDTGGWRWDIHSTIACSIWWALTLGPFIAAIIIDVSRGNARYLGQRPRPVRVPPSVPEALAIARLVEDGPAPPACPHRNAVKVDSAYYKRNFGRMVVFCCWCPDCETELPAAFRLPCCGTEPGDGTAPAAHMYNCPQAP